jgi:hypothetical protein
VPSPEDIEKMKKGSSFIFISLCIYAAIHIISITVNMLPMIMANRKLILILPMAFFWPAIAIWCAFQIRGYQGASYRVAGWVTIILISNNLRGLFQAQPNDVLSLIISGGVTLMLGISSFVAFKIRKNYFPHIAYHGVKKENGVYILGRRLT